VITVFLISLFESLFILPAHLVHAKPVDHSRRGLLPAIARLQARLSEKFDRFTRNTYSAILARALRYRGVTVAVFFGGLLVVGAWYESGRLNFTFDPRIEGDRVDAEITVPFGAPFTETSRVAGVVEQAGLRAADRFGPR